MTFKHPLQACQVRRYTIAQLAARMLSLLPAAILITSSLGATAGEEPAQTPAGSKQTWRCINGQGQASYSQMPCSGKADLIDVDDERSKAQMRQSRANNQRDLKLARQMQSERRHQERLAASQGPISLSGRHRGPHVIRSTPNDHRPVPISDQTRPVKLKSDGRGSSSKRRQADGLSAQGAAIKP